MQCSIPIGTGFPLKLAAYPSDPRPIPKPLSLGRMIEAAEILAEDLPFVRIDFYEVGDVPKFGEMTFYPGAGLDAFDPPEWDLKLGKFWPKGTYAASARRNLGFRAIFIVLEDESDGRIVRGGRDPAADSKDTKSAEIWITATAKPHASRRSLKVGLRYEAAVGGTEWMRQEQTLRCQRRKLGL